MQQPIYLQTSPRANLVTAIKRLSLIALLPSALGFMSGCNSSEAASPPPGPGSQSTPWGTPYPNMPDFVPPQVHATEYAPVAAAELGPPIDPVKGYRVESFGGGVYMVTEGAYQAMIVVSDVGAILVDAPPSIGASLLKAVNDVAPGAKVVELIYSHAHIDHIGYAGEIQKSNPAMTIAAHEETRKILARAQDAARPLPTVAFNTQDQDFPVVVGNQTLQLQYPGPNHEPGNIGIYHAGQKVLMLVDVIFPGWTMWRRLGDAQDVPGYFDLVKSMNSRWDFDHLIAGHVGRAGTKADVALQLDFLTDLHNAAYAGLVTVKPGETVNPKNANNVWAYYRDYVDRVTNHCVNTVSTKWTSKLAAYDVWVYDQCMAMEQSLRIDGPSIKP